MHQVTRKIRCCRFIISQTISKELISVYSLLAFISGCLYEHRSGPHSNSWYFQLKQLLVNNRLVMRLKPKCSWMRLCSMVCTIYKKSASQCLIFTPHTMAMQGSGLLIWSSFGLESCVANGYFGMQIGLGSDHISLNSSRLDRMEQTNRASVAQILQTARLLCHPLWLHWNRIGDDSMGERQDFPSGQPIQPVSQWHGAVLWQPSGVDSLTPDGDPW